MYKLEPHQFYLAVPFFSRFSNHTVLKTILAGITPGHIYANSINHPSSMMAQFRHRVYFSSNHDTTNQTNLPKFTEDVIFENCRQADVPLFRMATDSPATLAFLTQQLSDLNPIKETYQIYQCALSDPIRPAVIPEGYVLHPVSKILVEGEFPGKQDLLEEMCSERESVQAFLANSFGVVAFKDGILAGWCLSEYNYQQRIEVGIATMPPHRKLGLAKAMTHSFLKQAYDLGIERVLWHCSRSNVASSLTAKSAGFILIQDEPVLIVYLDQAINQAVHGNICFKNAEYNSALAWYQKALSAKAPQAWMARNAACAAAHLGKVDLAFLFLYQSIELGFTDLEHLVQSQHLLPLRDDPRWGQIITTLNQKLFTDS